jgi:hypothetical protein
MFGMLDGIVPPLIVVVIARAADMVSALVPAPTQEARS